MYAPERLNKMIHLWDTSGDMMPRENLERVLEIKLPRAKHGGEAEDELSMECGICYAYRLGDLVPDTACDRAECAKPYHRECLVEWLRALPDTRQSFNTLFGKCVYCELPITVSVTSQ